MLFSSITFLFYFLPIVLVLYYLVPSKNLFLRNMILLVASLIFYSWGEPVYVFLMIYSACFNWFMARRIEASKRRGDSGRIAMLFTVIVNLLILSFFKYFGFAMENINSIFGLNIHYTALALPIGISFYTFQALSYILDVYKDRVRAQKSLFKFALYLSFFPQLIAGPIVKYRDIKRQLAKRDNDVQGIGEGASRFILGLGKKVLLANNLGALHVAVSALPDSNISVLSYWIGIFAFTMQIYFDFSGYSDMAIGLGRMFGFEFEENFRYPFVAKSMREFMTRWHISLAAWFSSYVYKPLGGSRGENQDRMVRNLFIVWLLTGIWHGAAWTFVWWGLYYFIFIIAEMIIGIDKMEGHDRLRHVYVIIAVLISMVIFRSESSEQMVVYFKSMFGFTDKGIFSSLAVMFLQEYAVVFIASVICTIPVKDYYEEYIEDTAFGKAVAAGGNFLYVTFIPLMLIFCLAILEKGSYNPFIYFNF